MKLSSRERQIVINRAQQKLSEKMERRKAESSEAIPQSIESLGIDGLGDAIDKVVSTIYKVSEARKEVKKLEEELYDLRRGVINMYHPFSNVSVTGTNPDDIVNQIAWILDPEVKRIRDKMRDVEFDITMMNAPQEIKDYLDSLDNF
jgi:hypothetical protein